MENCHKLFAKEPSMVNKNIKGILFEEKRKRGALARKEKANSDLESNWKIPGSHNGEKVD